MGTLLIFSLLAITSNDWSVKRLKKIGSDPIALFQFSTPMSQSAQLRQTLKALLALRMVQSSSGRLSRVNFGVT